MRKTNRELIEEWMVCARLQSGCLIIRNKQTNCPLWSDSNYLQLFTYWPRQHSAAARFSWSKSLTQFFTKSEHKQFLSGSCYHVSGKQCLWLFWQPPPSTDNHNWWWRRCPVFELTSACKLFRQSNLFLETYVLFNTKCIPPNCKICFFRETPALYSTLLKSKCRTFRSSV